MEAFNTAFSLGGATLAWNGIVLAVSILVAVVVSAVLVKKRGAYKDLALDACIVGIPTGLLGARLFAAISGKVAFASFFDLTKAGLNLPGALLFAGVGIALYARIKKLSVAETFDILAPGAFFGLAVGRWSDFFLCDGLGPVAGANVPKFFPLVTFTPQYFSDGKTVAFAVFFLDFLVCAALGVTALLLKNRRAGTVSRVSIVIYLFAEFILEWLRDGSTRQIVFGEVRFNQIVLMAMLLFFVGLSLYLARRAETPAPASGAEPEKEPEEPAKPEEPEEPAKPEEPEEPAAEEAPEEPVPEESAEEADAPGEGEAE
ncbi:MAG: prolipoprotein diacylglyceryl transferase [Clostridia bacterium]|nr:prolipoprotein diacylglyceryl transferase [Clostridia bacterium]